MRAGTKSGGYTIVEVLIFVTVSSLMFIAAATMINGKQSAAAFRQSMNSAETNIRTIMNDVNNGLYPSFKTYTCTADENGGFPVFDTPSVEQGKNKGCVFIGKIIHFAPQGTNRIGYSVYTVAGRQYAADAKSFTPPTSFANTKARVVFDQGKNLDLTERSTLKQGLRFTKARDMKLGKDLAAIGFYSSGGGYDSSGTSLESGSQNILIVPYYDYTLDSPESTFNATLPTRPVDNNPNLLICFDNDKDWFGKLTIGSNSTNNQGQRLATAITLSRTKDTLCQES